MLSNIKSYLVTNISILSLALFPLVALPLAASAQSTQNQDADINKRLCQGADLQFGGDTSCSPGGESPADSVNDLIATVINIFSVVVGVVAVIMIIIGGFRYITSGGDSGNVTGAKNTILYAIIGLVIVAFAQFIVRFVLKEANDAAAGS